mmetsp:Transcript_3612/g.7991  ORF Transcript_3612/g.7991 Transcript_3612/m.7991 type:complete len:218 (-) Transcript_3612:566-1219(-)
MKVSVLENFRNRNAPLRIHPEAGTNQVPERGVVLLLLLLCCCFCCLRRLQGQLRRHETGIRQGLHDFLRRLAPKEGPPGGQLVGQHPKGPDVVGVLQDEIVGISPQVKVGKLGRAGLGRVVQGVAPHRDAGLQVDALDGCGCRTITIAVSITVQHRRLHQYQVLRLEIRVDEPSLGVQGVQSLGRYFEGVPYHGVIYGGGERVLRIVLDLQSKLVLP